MSTERKIFTITVLSWSGRIVGILSGLLLIPILFRLLKEAEVGLWMFFSQTLGAAAIFDLGFHQTLTRRIALTVGRERSENELPPQLSTDMIALIGLGRRVYNTLGMATFVLSAGLGLWLLQSHEVNAVSRSTAAISWLVLCGANAI